MPPALFERLATAWRAPRDTVPRLGILLDYERWTVLRNVAARRLQPLVDQGVAVEMFYAQQVDTLPGWFAGGEVRHDHLRDVIHWLRTQWCPGPIWPTVLSRTSSLVQAFARVDAAPDMLLDLAAIARSFGGTEGSEQAAKHARTALLWVGAQPSRVRCRALRTLAVAMLAQGQREAALALLDTAIKTAAVLQDPIEEASALSEIGIHEFQCGHHARSEARFRAALTLLPGDGPAYLRATLHHALALALVEQGKDAEQAEYHASTALGLRWDRGSQLASEDIALIARIRAQRAAASS
jgi:tetratricopeptide (TPR) repeat protein